MHKAIYYSTVYKCEILETNEDLFQSTMEHPLNYGTSIQGILCSYKQRRELPALYELTRSHL